MRQLRPVLAAALVASVVAAAPTDATAPETGDAVLRQAIEGFVRQRAAQAPRDVEIPSLRAFALPELATGQARVELSVHPRQSFEGRVPVTVVLREGGRELRRGVITVMVHIEEDALVAARSLRRGERLAAADLRLERRARAGLPGGWIGDPARAVGQRLRRGVSKGQPLRERWLEDPPRVVRGQIVRMRLARGPLRIETLGEARSDGRDGEWIRVLNRDSRRELRAQVVGDGVVHVEF